MNLSLRSLTLSSSRRSDAKRPPLKKVGCLLPIWGYAYVKKFLEVALPTWLADGNLPAVSRMAPTEFVFLTSREDEIYHTRASRVQAALGDLRDHGSFHRSPDHRDQLLDDDYARLSRSYPRGGR